MDIFDLGCSKFTFSFFFFVSGIYLLWALALVFRWQVCVRMHLHLLARRSCLMTSILYTGISGWLSHLPLPNVGEEFRGACLFKCTAPFFLVNTIPFTPIFFSRREQETKAFSPITSLHRLNTSRIQPVSRAVNFYPVCHTRNPQHQVYQHL